MVTKTFKFNNGDEVIEKITGLKGIITGTCYYLTGCNSYLLTVKPKDEYSEPLNIWFDEDRLDLVNSNVVLLQDVRVEENGSVILPEHYKYNLGSTGPNNKHSR